MHFQTPDIYREAFETWCLKAYPNLKDSDPFRRSSSGGYYYNDIHQSFKGYVGAMEQFVSESTTKYEDDWVTKLDDIDLEEAKKRLVLMHSWVKLHQHSVERANKRKNEAIALLQTCIDKIAKWENDIQKFMQRG